MLCHAMSLHYAMLRVVLCHARRVCWSLCLLLGWAGTFV